MPKQRHGGRNQRSQGGKAGGGSNRQGKLSYDAGDEPAFIRQFKERTGYKAPATAEDKVPPFVRPRLTFSTFFS